MNARATLVVSLMLAAVLGCARRAEKPSTVTILYAGDERVLGLPGDASAQFLVFLPLVARNARGEFEGRLARGWEHSADFHTWTIHLRSGVRWQDGIPVTASDIKFTLDFMSRPEVLRLAPGDVSVHVLDDTTCTVTSRGGTVGSPLDDWTVYYPRHLLERLDPKTWEDWAFWVQPVGNGPYRYVRRVPRTMIELEANPDYYCGPPRIGHVVLRFGSKLVTELLSGNADAMENVRQADLPKLAADPRFMAYHAFDLSFVRALVWNTRHPALRDPKVRRALTLAIDRRELDQALNLPLTTPIFDAIVTERQLRRGELPAPLPYDPNEARRLLAEAGWADVGPDGIRRRGGEPLHFGAMVNPLAQLDQAAVLIQAQLRAVGIRMDIQPLVVPRVQAGAFDALLSRMPSSGRWTSVDFFGPGSPSGYTDPRAAALRDRAIAAVDPDDVDRAYRELAPILQADMPITFLGPLVVSTVAHRRLRGLSSPYRTSPVTYMDELWLEERGP